MPPSPQGRFSRPRAGSFLDIIAHKLLIIKTKRPPEGGRSGLRGTAFGTAAEARFIVRRPCYDSTFAFRGFDWFPNVRRFNSDRFSARIGNPVVVGDKPSLVEGHHHSRVTSHRRHPTEAPAAGA